MIKKCVVCEEWFETKDGTKTCSIECHSARVKEQKRAEKARYYARYPGKKKAEYARAKRRDRERFLAAHPEIAEQELLRKRLRAEMAAKVEQRRSRACAECGVSFPAKNNVKTCSEACWMARNRKLRKRPERFLSYSERMQKKRDDQNKLNLRRKVADDIIRAIKSKGLEALL